MYNEGKRELVSAIISPLVWMVIAVFFIAQGFVNPENAKIYWDVALINIVASVLSFFISYKLVFKR